ncbi:MAG: 3-hydroxyacyl-CoA dehydrogenase NAD-binding domain-containing protein [Conexivisphaerales archaeon]
MIEGPAEVAVIGAGTMGHGIAEVSAIAGLKVHLNDVDNRFLEDAKRKIEESLKKLQVKNQLKENSEDVARRISYELDISKAVSSADLVIEAVPEKIDLKLQIFKKLDMYTKKTCVLATNTSSLPITEISSAVSDPKRVVGIHFFNPPVLMKLIEIISGEYTSPQVLEYAGKFSDLLGKKHVVVRKDVPGFIVNRILVRFMSTARLLVENRLASIEEVDSALKYRAGLPMGVFELADYIGLDVVYFVERALSERGFTVPKDNLLEPKVKNNNLGMKTGSGFYTYSKDRPRAAIREELSNSISPSIVLSPAINEASWLISNDVTTRDDIDTSTVLGLGFQKGLLRMADEWGVDIIIESLNHLKEKLHLAWLEPQPLLLRMKEENKLGRKTGIGFYNYT